MAFTVSNVATQVKRAFGDEAAIQITDSDIVRWVNAGMRDIVIKHKVLKQSAVTPTVANQYEYDVENLNILQIQTIRVSNHPVDYRSFQHAEEYIQEHDPDRSATGQPDIWYKWGNTIGFWPTPDFVGDIRIYFMARPTEVTAVGDTIGLPDEYFNRVVEYVMSQAYELDEDNENSSFKLNQFNQNLDVMAGDIDSPQNQAYSRITVLPEDL